MAGPIVIGLLLAMAYLLGSIPTGYLVAKLLKGIDIREHGSGNTGATNVLRVVGKPAGISVLIIDLLKGVAAIMGTRWLYPLSQSNPSASTLAWLVTLSGLLAILGHSRSIWLGFTGGKSAATGLGVILALLVYILVEAITNGAVVYQLSPVLASLLPVFIILVCSVFAFRFTR